MENVHIFDTKLQLAETAARQAIKVLQTAILQHGSATWVLAGGTTPALAYQIIAENFLARLDWSKVTFVIGDERIAPFDSPDNNWHLIEEVFLKHIPQATFLRPESSGTAENGAGEYATKINQLPKTENQLPRLDLVWLGMGEDGHTLSLFPNHPGLAPTDQLVIPIHDSPKPPADRITLTFHALGGTQQCVILAAGASKAPIVRQIKNGADLPVVTASKIPKHTTWMLAEIG